MCLRCLIALCYICQTYWTLYYTRKGKALEGMLPLDYYLNFNIHITAFLSYIANNQKDSNLGETILFIFVWFKEIEKLQSLLLCDSWIKQWSCSVMSFNFRIVYLENHTVFSLFPSFNEARGLRTLYSDSVHGLINSLVARLRHVPFLQLCVTCVA